MIITMGGSVVKKLKKMLNENQYDVKILLEI
jgi:hypothetical protein